MSNEPQVAKKAFSGRALVSVLTTLTFIALAFTGCILFVTPPGRVANWTGWTILGLSKHDWGGLHITSSCLFLVCSALHIWLNWKPLLNYFKNRASKKFAFRIEWAVAAVIFAVVLAGTQAGIPPFSTILDLNEKVKNSWEDKQIAAPSPHTELLSLAELSEKNAVSLEVIMERLEAKEIAPESDAVTLAELADEHGLAANEIYGIALDVAPRGGGCAAEEASQQGKGKGKGQGGAGGGGYGQGKGQGLGQMTLVQYCENKGLPFEEVSAQLRAEGFDPVPDQTIRDIAAQKGVMPYQLSIIKH